ncbi:hypothetical protein MKK75_29745 [Methylobacterium sp. J-030]|uniref:hypothetical protein n=1 Tax=Methylobacterium sp. J-030 TaxID=2836627 RepID=UPI001FB93F55|nr:hypothetical protein [Methylobacterium sp. J-030]MCJ2072928.1 hypothetical protein [Methylobacterium sp. J-030]
MQRMGGMVGLEPGRVAPCWRPYAAVRPEILDPIGHRKIPNDAIVLRKPETLPFGTWDDHGTTCAAARAPLEGGFRCD